MDVERWRTYADLPGLGEHDMTAKQILRRLPKGDSPLDGIRVSSGMQWRFPSFPAIYRDYFTDGYLAVRMESPGVRKVMKLFDDLPVVKYNGVSEFAEWTRLRYSVATSLELSEFGHGYYAASLKIDCGLIRVDPLRLRRLIELSRCDSICIHTIGHFVPDGYPVAAFRDGRPVGFLMRLLT